MEYSNRFTIQFHFIELSKATFSAYKILWGTRFLWGDKCRYRKWTRNGVKEKYDFYPVCYISWALIMEHKCLNESCSMTHRNKVCLTRSVYINSLVLLTFRVLTNFKWKYWRLNPSLNKTVLPYSVPSPHDIFTTCEDISTIVESMRSFM